MLGVKSRSLDFLKLWSQLKHYLLKVRYGSRGFPVLPGLAILLFIIASLFGELLAPYSAIEARLSEIFIPPFFQANGSMAHPLGTDMLGRDLLSRIIVGARPSFIVALAVVAVGGLGGTALGIISGYHGGKVDMVLMRVADSTMAFPMILAAMLLAAILGPSLQNVIVAISVIIWARFARVIRGETLSLKEQDFVAQARVSGTSRLRIMLQHIFPNVVPTLLVLMTLEVGFVIVTESMLSFLGAGVPPPLPVWGGLVARGREYITVAWWVPFFPGLALTIVVLSFNMLGDWLREIVDPKLRQA